MNIILVMNILDLVSALANSVLKTGSPGMNYAQVSNTLVQIVQKALQVYQEHTGAPMDLTLIKGESLV